MMFWEVSGIGSEVIGPLPSGTHYFRNALPGHSFSGYFFPSFYSFLSSPLGVTLVPDSGSCLFFLSLVFISCFCL